MVRTTLQTSVRLLTMDENRPVSVGPDPRTPTGRSRTSICHLVVFCVVGLTCAMLAASIVFVVAMGRAVKAHLEDHTLSREDLANHTAIMVAAEPEELLKGA